MSFKYLAVIAAVSAPAGQAVAANLIVDRGLQATAGQSFNDLPNAPSTGSNDPAPQIRGLDLSPNILGPPGPLPPEGEDGDQGATLTSRADAPMLNRPGDAVQAAAPAETVSEPAAWALMIVGFLGAGMGLRRSPFTAGRAAPLS